VPPTRQSVAANRAASLVNPEIPGEVTASLDLNKTIGLLGAQKPVDMSTKQQRIAQLCRELMT
jgi:hypothetical protein